MIPLNFTHKDVGVELLLVCNVHDGVPGVHQVKVAVGEGGLGRVQLAEGHAGLDLKKDEKNDDLKKIS